MSISTSRLRNIAPLCALVENNGDNNSGASLSSSTATPALDEEDDLELKYRLPPHEIRDIVNAPPLPALSFSPHRDKILFLKRRALPPLAELARPEEKLAVLRIDGKCNTRNQMSFYTGIGIHQLMPDGTLGLEKEIHGFPDGTKINFVTWSSDGKHLAFSVPAEEDENNSSNKLTIWLLMWKPEIQSNEKKSLFKLEQAFV